MNKERLESNFSIAFDAVKVNKIRSLLTALGIIFGVAAVISMLSIGRGAQVELLEQIKLVGVNNIVITPIVEQEEEEVSKNENTQKEILNMSNGLSLHDSESILGVIPGIDRVSPEVVLDTYIIKSGLRRSAKLVGIEPDYFDIADFELVQGLMFSDEQLEKGLPVCIIGSGIKAKFFSKENAIGKMLKCGNNWLRVIGVLENKSITKTSIENLGIRNYNMDVYTPIKTVLLRYTNRSLITERLIKLAANPDENRELLNRKNYHQIDRLVVQVSQSDKISNIADVISRMLKRRHNGIVDYQIEIPELLLKQQQRTNDIFNYVLGAIAGISLIVGGIGIMNIMLASVMERIKEIGLRIALGARKNDIIMQFLFEAVTISVAGGIIGVILGILLASAISTLAEIPTVIAFDSIMISFLVAASVGLIFGIAPARRAAMQDPIISLRHE